MGEEYPFLQVPLWIDLLAIGAGALSGAAAAVRYRFDLVGVLLMAVLTGLGGGIIRDVLLGLRPVAVTNEAYLWTALGAGVAAMVLLRAMNRWTQLFSLFDAMALGLFTIAGVEKAVLNDVPAIGALFIGVMTGVGGGVLHEVVSDQPVQIVRRGSWNAAAAILGAGLYLALRSLDTPVLVVEVLTFAAIVGARFSSLHFGWQTAEAGDLLARVGRRRPSP